MTARKVERWLTGRLGHLLARAPVVVLTGARQVGKSTLVRELASSGEFPARYLTLDDLTVLAAARSDPAGFLAGLEGPVILDEVQRSPDLLLAVKAEVDRDRRAGRFLLTGSASPLFLPEVGDALAGRMREVTLRPLAQAERLGHRPWLLDALLDGAVPTRPRCFTCGFPTDGATGTCPQGHPGGLDPAGLVDRLVKGGFPEVVLSDFNADDRRDWFESYVRTVLERSIRDLARIDGVVDLPRLLAVIAAETGAPANYSNLSRRTGLKQTTLKRYLALLRAAFLVERLPAWSRNEGRRHLGAPKLHLADTGLMAHLLGLGAGRLLADRNHLGPLLETFVVGEVLKLASASAARPTVSHYRNRNQREVDLVLDTPDGAVVGLEVKASATVAPADFKGLRALAGDAGDRLRAGVVLYTGNDPVPFGPRLHALPLSMLWGAPPP